MKAHELSYKIREVMGEGGTGSHLIMVKDLETGEIYDVKDVTVEYHEDTHSYTHWIHVRTI